VADRIRARIDWAKDGFGSTGVDDVSGHVRGSIEAQYGRDQSSALEPMVSGRGGLALDNNADGAERRYSPGNASSPLFGLLKPARPVLVERTVSGTTYAILAAHTDDQPINPDVDSRQVSLSLVDYLADFRRPTISTELYQGLFTGEIIDLILDEVGWTGGRDLDTGSTVVPWWWAESETAFDALSKILASEGSPALLTIGPSGEVVFRDRQHRLVRSASTTSQQTWRGRDDSAEPRMAKGFSYDAAWRNVVNDVTISVEERRPAPVLSDVWSTDELIVIAASDTVNFEIQTSDPFFDAISPVEGTDFTVTSGAIASTGLSRTSGASATLSITATGAGARLDGVKVRAKSVPVVRMVKARQSDATSITDYGSAGIPSGMEPVWVNRYDAQALADLYVLQRKQPLPILSVRFVCGIGDDTRLALLLARDLSDRVTVVEPETGTNGDFFIESIRHEINGRHEHVITFGLEAAPSAPSNPFILGTSVLNTGTLGY
jgi:hypothetical protein